MNRINCTLRNATKTRKTHLEATTYRSKRFKGWRDNVVLTFANGDMCAISKVGFDKFLTGHTVTIKVGPDQWYLTNSDFVPTPQKAEPATSESSAK